MDALKMLKAAKRYCKSVENCCNCELGADNCLFDPVPEHMSEYVMHGTVTFLEEWEKNHPIKTRAELFFERNPDAKPEPNTDIPFIEPCNYLGSKKNVPQCPNYVSTSCHDCRVSFWKEEIEDEKG